jgi:formaldehyde-activating enzyme involved in methanogenesis
MHAAFVQKVQLSNLTAAELVFGVSQQTINCWFAAS